MLILPELKNHIEKSLNENLLLIAHHRGEQANQTFYLLIKGNRGQTIDRHLDFLIEARFTRSPKRTRQHLIRELCHPLTNRIRRITHETEQGDQKANSGRATNKQGLIRDDLITINRIGMALLIGQKLIDHQRAFPVRAGQYGDIAQRVSSLLQALDDSGQTKQGYCFPIILLVLRHEFHPNMPQFFLKRLRNILDRMRVSAQYLITETLFLPLTERGRVQCLIIKTLQKQRSDREQGIIKRDDMTATPPIISQCLLAGQLRREILPYLLVQQFPVGVPEAIDTLLHVANDQVCLAPREAIPQQWEEIMPLHGAGILKFVDHVMVDPRAGLLIDKGCVAPVDHPAQQIGRIGDEHHVLLFPIIGQLTGDIHQDT